MTSSLAIAGKVLGATAAPARNWTKRGSERATWSSSRGISATEVDLDFRLDTQGHNGHFVKGWMGMKCCENVGGGSEGRNLRGLVQDHFFVSLNSIIYVDHLPF